MLFQQAWSRLTGDWRSFGVMALGPFLMGIAIGLVGTIGLLVAAGSSLYAIGSLSRGSSAGLFGLIGGLGLYGLILAAAALCGGALSSGGLIGSVVAYRNGESVSLGLFWSHATRHFGSFLGLSVLLGLIMMVLSVVAIPLLLIPLIGQLVMLAVYLACGLYLGIYPGYLIVADGLGTMAAVGASFKALTRNYNEAGMGLLTLLGFAAVMMLGFVLNMIPLIGTIVWMGIIYVGMVFSCYYFAERFEANVRPLLQ